MISVSVVVPVYSGENFLRELVVRIAAARDGLAGSGTEIREVIFVDDAAVNSSPAILDQISQDNHWVSVIHLARNFGQHAATIAGIARSGGDWIVTMDEDLQHPPSKIPDLLRKVAETGSDIVYASATNGVHNSVFQGPFLSVLQANHGMADGQPAPPPR